MDTPVAGVTLGVTAVMIAPELTGVVDDVPVGVDGAVIVVVGAGAGVGVVVEGVVVVGVGGMKPGG
jgi:hypothetical protein